MAHGEELELQFFVGQSAAGGGEQLLTLKQMQAENKQAAAARRAAEAQQAADAKQAAAARRAAEAQQAADAKQAAEAEREAYFAKLLIARSLLDSYQSEYRAEIQVRAQPATAVVARSESGSAEAIDPEKAHKIRMGVLTGLAAVVSVGVMIISVPVGILVGAALTTLLLHMHSAHVTRRPRPTDRRPRVSETSPFQSYSPRSGWSNESTLGLEGDPALPGGASL
jgi:hypothetical protein